MLASDAMRFELIMDAGNGAQKAGDILIKRFSEDYQDVIKEAKGMGLHVIGFTMPESVESMIKELGGNGKNMFYMGVLSVVFELDSDLLMKEIRSTFKKLKDEVLDKNISIYEEGRLVADSLDLEKWVIPSSKKSSKDNILLDGNTAFSLGIIDSGIKLYSGYPITPASTIMHNLAKLFPAYGGVLHQAEDEIAGICSAIGAAFTGDLAVTATTAPSTFMSVAIAGSLL